jgi:hypothetical protein
MSALALSPISEEVGSGGDSGGYLSSISKAANPVSTIAGIAGDIYGIYNSYQNLKEQKRVNRANEELNRNYLAEDARRYGEDLSMRQRDQRFNEGVTGRTLEMNERASRDQSALNKENIIDKRVNRQEQKLRNKVAMAAQMTAALMTQASTPAQRAGMASIWGR